MDPIGPYLTLIAVLLAAGALLAAATAYLMARGLVRPPRMNDGKALYVLRRLTPRDLGLAYEITSFQVRDETMGRTVNLMGWWMPGKRGGEGERGRGGDESEISNLKSLKDHSQSPPLPLSPSPRTVILIHGYADAKIGAIAWAPAWHELGFNVLAIDLRAHGESDGQLCTGGFHERHDLLQVVHQLIAREPDATQTLLLFGASMGAGVVCGAAELLEPTSLHGVVLESPSASFRSASAAHFERLGLPGGFLRRWGLRLAEWLTAANFTAIRPADVIRRLQCPVLVLASGDDLYVTAAEASELEQSIAARPPSAGPARYVCFPEVPHLMAVVEEPEAYSSALRDFVELIPVKTSTLP